MLAQRRSELDAVPIGRVPPVDPVEFAAPLADPVVQHHHAQPVVRGARLGPAALAGLLRTGHAGRTGAAPEVTAPALLPAVVAEVVGRGPAPGIPGGHLAGAQPAGVAV